MGLILVLFKKKIELMPDNKENSIIYLDSSIRSKFKDKSLTGRKIQSVDHFLKPYITDSLKRLENNLYSFLPIKKKNLLVLNFFGRNTLTSEIVRDFALLEAPLDKNTFISSSPSFCADFLVSKNSHIPFFLRIFIFYEFTLLMVKQIKSIISNSLRFLFFKLKISLSSKKNIENPINGNEKYFVFTFVDKGCFLNNENKFYDRYFPDIQKVLAQPEDKFVFLINFTEECKNVSYIEKIRNIYPNSFCVEELIEVKQYFYFLINFYFSYFYLFISILNSENKKFIFLYESLRYAPATGLMSDEILSKIKKLGFFPRFFLNTFENLEYEKRFLVSVKKIFPLTQTIGFFHSARFTNQPMNDLNSVEIELGLFPDIIVSNGLAMHKVIQELYPSLIVKLGPTLRYKKPMDKDFLDQHYSNFISQNSINNFLLLCNFDMVETLSAMQLIDSYLTNYLKKSSIFRVRLHPALSLANFQQYALSQDYDLSYRKNIFISSSALATLEEELQVAQYVFIQGTSAVIDALRVGKPSIIIGSFYSLTKVPCVNAEMSNLVPICYNEDDLACNLNRYISLSYEEKKDDLEKRVFWYNNFYLSYKDIDYSGIFY